MKNIFLPILLVLLSFNTYSQYKVENQKNKAVKKLPVFELNNNVVTLQNYRAKKTNALYEELMWEHDEVLEFVPDHANDQIIIRRKKFHEDN